MLGLKFVHWNKVAQFCIGSWLPETKVQNCAPFQKGGLRACIMNQCLLYHCFPPVLCDWVIKGLGVYSLVYATGHIKDPVSLIEKRRGLSPGGRFPPSFIKYSSSRD